MPERLTCPVLGSWTLVNVPSGQLQKLLCDFSAHRASERSFEAKTRRIKRSDSFLRPLVVKEQRSHKTKIYSVSARQLNGAAP